MKSNIYYIGDSWNEFPKHIENRVDDYLLYHGAGIEKVWQSSKGGRKNADITVLTIPGFVRSIQFMKDIMTSSHMNTHFWCKTFYEHMQEDENFLDEYLAYYCNLLKGYYEEQKNLVYFIFNTGGWPYRHPYNMAYHGVEDFEQTMLDWFEESGMRYTYLNLQGQKGMCRKEEDAPNEDFIVRFGREYYDKTLGWNVPSCYHDKDIYPSDGFITDHHPSPEAEIIAAKHIEAYLAKTF